MTGRDSLSWKCRCTDGGVYYAHPSPFWCVARGLVNVVTVLLPLVLALLVIGNAGR